MSERAIIAVDAEEREYGVASRSDVITPVIAFKFLQ